MVKRSSKIFEDSSLKNGILEFWSEALIVSILTYYSNDNYVHNRIMIFIKIVITNFHEKWRKLSIMSFSEIQIIKDDIKNSLRCCKALRILRKLNIQILRTVQRFGNRVDLEKYRNMSASSEYLFANIGFDTAENAPA